MKLFNKKSTHLLTALSLSVVMIGLFQNCSQTGSLSLSTEMQVEAQNMSNTFYVLKNIPEIKLKPILTNKEATALSLKAVNEKSTDTGNFKVGEAQDPDSAEAPVADSTEIKEVFEIKLPKSFPIPTEHGLIHAINKHTGVFAYEPNPEYEGEDKFNLNKMLKMEVNAETKDAIKDEDGKYYLVKVLPIPIKIIIHGHITPPKASSTDPSKMGVSSAEEPEEVVLGPVESDRTSPDKPMNVDDGKFPDQLTQSAKISWTHSSDEGTGINFYEVAVGTKPGEVDMVKWTNVGFVTNAAVDGKFIPDTTYYTSVRSVDFAGLRSEVVTGDGWQSTAMTNAALAGEVSSQFYSANPQLEFKVKFSQPVDKFTSSSFTIANITGTPVVTGSGRNFTVTAVSNLNGNADFKITKNAIVDILGNRNAADITGSIVRPKVPTSIAFGAVPNSLSQSPTITWAADASASDKGWASYTVNIYNGSTKIKSQPNFTKGNSVSDLTLMNGANYSVKIQGTDVNGYLGAESTAASWTVAARSLIQQTAGVGTNMDVSGNSSPTYGNWVEFQFMNSGAAPSGMIATSLSNPTNFEIWSNATSNPNSAAYKGCQGLDLTAGSKCSVFVRSKATDSGALAGSNLTLACNMGCPPSIPLSGNATGFVFITTADGGSNITIDRSWLTNRGWNGTWSVKINNSGSYNSYDVLHPALKIDVAMPAGKTLTFVNCSGCVIVGRGGTGGAGGQNSGSNGSPGGPGLAVTNAIFIENNGIIAGGGGGGGGAGGWHGGGGGGGGGIGGSSGGSAGEGIRKYQGGIGYNGTSGEGGSQTSGGAGGAGGMATVKETGMSTSAIEGYRGAGTGGGAGGTPGSQQNTGMPGGGGGGGGGYGAPGGSGGRNTYGSSGAGQGGAGGACVNGANFITWSVVGQRYGSPYN